MGDRVFCFIHWESTGSFGAFVPSVGLGIFGSPETGVDWSIMSAATLISVAPLLIAFLIFQKQFVQSFMQAGIK